MAGLIYYVGSGDSGGSKLPPLGTLGLAAVFTGRGLEQRGTEAGPAGAGTVFRPQRADADEPLLGCWPASDPDPARAQTWEDTGKGYWLGHWPAAPPMPADLVRPDLIDGHPVRLGDGNDWLIPVARVFPAGSRLPMRLTLGPDGWEGAVLPAYADLSRRAGEFWEFLLAAEGDSIALARWIPLAVDALAVNYHLNDRGASHLGILTNQNILTILGALVDTPSLVKHRESMEKKTAPGCGGSPSAPGPAGG